MEKIVTVTFELNDGCTQTLDWSSIPKKTDLIQLAKDWKNDLGAKDFKLDRQKL